MRIVVAMSGGVDSSVTAALLKQQGHEVIGITMQIWADYSCSGKKSCCSPSHLDDARLVCDRLEIPYYVLNFQDIFEEKIINYFCREYLAGRTPSPCVPCNHELKFKALWQKAQNLGAKYLASGHYARIIDEGGSYFIKRGLDSTKDQSYFLYGLTQDMLSHTLFPLGDYKKSQVREIAQRLELPVAQKSESQEICFIPDNDYRGFLQKRCPGMFVKGDILNTSGKKIGEHEGIALYTVGQRKGLGVASLEPLYVVKIDAENNTVTVGKDADLKRNTLRAENINWMGKFKEPFRAKAQIRYRHQAAEAVISPLENNHAHIEFNEPQRAITPGQSVVFYNDDRVLGGGIIQG